MTRQEFLRYLRETLIPDLRDSGSYATAADFCAAVLFIEGADEVEIGYGEATELHPNVGKGVPE